MSARSPSFAPRLALASLLLCWAIVGDAAGKTAAKTAAAPILADSFRTKGQAGMDRLEQDDMQRACSRDTAPDMQAAGKIQAAALASVKFPADGKFLGDWQAGEKVAQTGTGMQSSDDPAQANGGNCYACHQLAPKEIAYGTLGPSLTQYGKQRGNSEAMLKFAWARIWNSHAYNACSFMPRFGDAHILTEAQLKDVMALLFDPASPVNQ